jgi:hypothetical protein
MKEKIYSIAQGHVLLERWYLQQILQLFSRFYIELDACV